MSVFCNQKGVTTKALVVSNGVFSILLAFASIPFVSNRLVMSPWTLSLPTLQSILLAAGSQAVSYILVIISVILTQRPTLISIFRSSEIPIAYVAECLLTAQLPDTMSVCGAVLTMVAIAAMAHHDQINQWLADWWGSKESGEGQQ